MKKSIFGKWLVLAVVAALLCTVFAGCKQDEPPKVKEPEQTDAPAEPTVTETESTEPEITEPEPTETEPVILQAGTMDKHMKGKDGDKGIYFTMEPNEIPVDTTWATEFRPTNAAAIKLYRDGETYDIGRTAAGMIIKYSETEYYLKLEEWLLRDYFPVRDGDILLIDGRFRNTVAGVTFQIEPSYIQISEGLVFFSTEYPTGSGVNVKHVGSLSSHPNGKTTDGIYFTLGQNSVPYNKDWTLEYSPTSESCIQLIRDGNTYNIGNKAAGSIVKYSETECYLKLENWIIKDYYPIRDGDILKVSGKFVNSGVSTVFSISTTYISIQEGLLNFSTEYPDGSSGIEAVQFPTLNPHPNGYTGTGVYFKEEENSLPFEGWSVEYFPKEASCIKLIRNGQTYDIANPNAGTVVKYSETDYYLKLEKWIYKDYFPFVDGDILVVEGKFVNSGLAALFEVSKTYISISGGMAYFSNEYPEGPVGPTQIQGGTMNSHPDGWNPAENGGLWFKLNENDAPFATDWSLRYTPSASSNVKLIRDGVSYDVANTGAEMLVKYRETDYYLEFWPISQKPIVEGDTLVIEGSFVNAANDVVLVIEKTYVTIENGQPVFSTSVDSVIAGGYMQPHDNGWNANSNDGLYFTLAANEVPYDGWNTEYEPVSAACIKLTRNGETVNIAIPSRGTIVKFGDTEYYLKLAQWTIGDYFPVVPGDVLTVEGNFKNAENGVIFSISKTVITVGDDYSLTFAEDGSGESGVIEAGVMSSHPNGWNTSNNKGLYFSLTANEVPYTDDWTTVYFPTDAGNIKLVRNGETVELAQTDREYIVKFADTGYYLKLEKWTIGDYFPLVAGDMLIVEGEFTNALNGVTFAISKTYITIGENYVLTFSENAPEAPEVPDQDTTIKAGALIAHPEKGFNTSSNDGLYAIMAANTAPYDGWNIEYTPAEAGNYKLVRSGVTYDIGVPGRGTLVKYSDTEYYLKFGWCVGDYANTITVGDQLIVEGKWNQNTGGDAVMEITKTVITIGENYVLTFASEGTEPEQPDEPDVPDVPVVPENDGPMYAHSANGWTATGGLYFTMAENDAPYNDWNIRYTPTAEGNVKLIRNGVTYDVGHTQRETICKYSATEYYYEFWTLDTYKPVLAGDILVIEGEFVHAASGSVINIAKTTITFHADGTATFASEATQPEEPEVPVEPENDGAMSAHPEHGWTESGGLYFTMAENAGVFDGWNIRYTPTAEENVKLIRNGVTYNVGHTQRETICKYSATEYYYEFWTLDTYKPVLAGDVLVVEGEFVHAASGSKLNIAKTTITFHADGTATFQSEVVEPETPDDDALQVGNMTENSGGITNGIIYFSLAENELPSGLTKSDFRPVDAGVIKLIRDGVTYDVANPETKTIVKQTASKYRLLRSALTMELQTGDILVVDGKFIGGNKDEEIVYTIAIGKTYIFIGDGSVTFTTEPPEEE